ncbi:MAG TPA: fumarylacetoacetate hydrolase family protein [Caulobacteraceae bacterium]|jgi:ureidoglycolate lyase|nr:fumarylacetoacetate hydrolase family protein [Caulobacteraceae bacterium]
MKLATFSAGAEPELGVVADDRIVSLSRAAPRLAADMIDLIRSWEAVEAEVRRIAGSGGARPLSEVRLMAPIRRPGKIMAMGLNYADHIEEANLGRPEYQTWFSKAPSAANGPFDPIQRPRVSSQLDYEAELVAVIGGGGRHVTKGAASKAVFGFCAGNDVSVRDWQLRTSQWVIGKSFDTHAPFGPWITTTDEVGDPHVLSIRGVVNGEIRQNSNTRNLVFDVWDQVAQLSDAMTLEPGDVIYTGTPAGVGMAMKPPRFLKAGDRVRVEIERLGAIENIVAEEA